MINVKVICGNGNSWTTSINGTFDEAKEYFLGKTFVDEDVETGRESFKIVTDVEYLGEVDESLVWYVEGSYYIIDEIDENGLTRNYKKDEATVLKLYPNAKKMTWKEADQKIKEVIVKSYEDEGVEEISEDKYNHLFNVLLPMDMKQSSLGVTFKMAEEQYMGYARIVAKVGDEYFTFIGDKSMTHLEIIEKCKNK